MMTLDKEMAIQKIIEMPAEKVSKVLIFMAGMEAEHIISRDGKDVSGSREDKKKQKL